MSPRPPTPPPWKRKNPKTRSRTLTPAQRRAARARARAAGRRYPNLVDNMAVTKTGGAAPRKRRPAAAGTSRPTARGKRSRS